jgi:preprotein translocase subunit SecE
MNKAINFFREAYTELKKSVWLSRQQMVQSTIFVFVVVFIVALYVSGIDFALSKLLSQIVGGR